ncbi:LLM class flavin-dependent oxidoreductase [Nonomuraea pusilla]|uniref:Flavin-dependent oxidoreductase, luciferase family (Includes alkanesulfonate monooxygenase SsuD and methylene tetrahydromethanopterin reductase) n=1 Tax=Nonomuraea pusilla TaxID=46177 RepID=A0A1H8BET9_9ACTN|nr:LLM class flavin-dependent oxidoreductase [Nonomuraea pusilla]SEM81460.1 Flavin-dependent oxidoreductase, luciferase family (includes alkanesulfonate monooxygenase SsuD and methylene tetrahydromethanopterin reductase) [Nonomuraea pusilla]
MRLGVMFDRDLPPEQLIPFARALDATSVDDLWVVEDLGWTGAISSAATALAVTSRLRVGIGITPAPLRNPMLLAMELANLARVHPGRLAAGIGHGVRDWMRQVGAAPSSPLALLEETVTAVRALLRGETVTLHGKAVHLDGVRLVHPPAEPPTVLTGVVGPRSLALSGRVAQGTIVPEGYGPPQLPAVIEQIGATGDHEVTVFTYLYVGADAAEATREAAEEQARFLGVPPEEVTMASGTAEEAAARVKGLWAAGAHTVAVRPLGPDPLSHVTALLSAL